MREGRLMDNALDNILFGSMLFTTDNRFVNMTYTITKLNIHGEIEIPIEKYSKAIADDGLVSVKKLLVTMLKEQLEDLEKSLSVVEK